MGRAANLAALLWVAGCAAAPTPPPAAPEPAPAEIEGIAGGGTVVIQRPTPRWARLSLWLSVGAAHADPPALATVAARWAAQAAGAQARVLPDATELALDCDLEQTRLARCARALASALRAPAPTEAELGVLMRRLRADQARRGPRPLDFEALSALLGEAAVAGWDPLALPAGGDVSAVNVQAFMDAHYGANRALLVAAGDVDGGALSGWAEGARAARQPRAPSVAEVDVHDGRVHVVPGARPAVVLAVQAPSLQAASRLGRAFTVPHPGTGANAFVVGSHALLLLRVPTSGSPWGELRSAAFDAWRLAVEGTPDAPEEAPAQDLTSLCRRTGEAWVHGGTNRTQAAPWPVAAAVAIPALSPVAPSQEGELDAVLREAQGKAQGAMDAARAQLDPATRGPSDDDDAEVRLTNGLRIEVQRRPNDAGFAASIEVAGGAGLDGAAIHGRAALLATLTSSACAYASRPALAEALRREGTHMRPLVSGDAWGVLARGPAAHWQSGLDRLLRCAVRPSFRSRDVEDARVALLSELGSRVGAEQAWQAARTLLPEAPGALAPWGNPGGVAAVGLRDLRSLHSRSLRGGGVIVRVRAPAPAGEVAQWVARRLAQLPEGAAPTPSAAAAAPTTLSGIERSDQAASHAWIGFAARDAVVDDAALVGLAEQVGYRLDALPGYSLRGVAGGGQPFTWFWLDLLVTDPAQLDALPAAVRAAARATKQSLPEALAPVLARAERSRRAADSDAASELRRLFLAHDAQPGSTGLLRRVLDAEPRFVISHPATP